jgi:hypothetical protein
MVLGQEEGQAKREEGGKEPVGSPWAVDGLDPPSAHAHQPSRHYFCWAWALGGVNGRSIIRRHSSFTIHRYYGTHGMVLFVTERTLIK